MRASSDMFRLHTAQEIMDRVAFHNTGPNQLPGLIVMTISDTPEPDFDETLEFIVVLVNANDEAQTFSNSALSDLALRLHRVQENSVDEVVKNSTYESSSGTFMVPGRTTAVFVQYEPETRIGFLIEDVQALVDAGVLNEGQGSSLIVKLEGAIDKLAKGQPNVAINKLNAFINEVMSLIDEGVLSPEQGQPLIVEATDIIWQIEMGFYCAVSSAGLWITDLFLPFLTH